MLPRPHRLAASADIQAVVRYGRILKTPWVRLHYQARPDQAHSRVACVVGRKVHARAVIRHRYQRWLRQLSHSLILILPSPHDIVLVAQPPITALTTTTTRAAAQAHLLQFLDKAVPTSDN